MRVYQANTELPPIEFKTGYDSDIHMIWGALEKEINDLKEQQAKYNKKPPSEDVPETTEQVMMEVMAKDTKSKDGKSKDTKKKVIVDSESSSHSSKKSEHSSKKSEHNKKPEPKRDTLYIDEELTAKTCKELKLLAKEHGIKTSVKVDGVSRPINKQELIDKLVLIKA
jgi:hypothetical protein